jgi:hypothetical protein
VGIRSAARNPGRSEAELQQLATHPLRRKPRKAQGAPARPSTKPPFTRLPDRYVVLPYEALQDLWTQRCEDGRGARCPACRCSPEIALGLAVSGVPFLYRFACGQCGWQSQWFRVLGAGGVAEMSFDSAAGGH